jgi:hypothetical protein
VNEVRNSPQGQAEAGSEPSGEKKAEAVSDLVNHSDISQSKTEQSGGEKQEFAERNPAMDRLKQRPVKEKGTRQCPTCKGKVM